MAKIETRLREWAATIVDRELDDEDKDNLYDELARAANEIEELANENKELRDERDVDHYANIALYSALEEERKKHEWVSVKDRLPEEGQVVIACGKKSATSGMYQGIGTKPEYWWWRGKTIKTVTHWMPLPDPPKGEIELVLHAKEEADGSVTQDELTLDGKRIQMLGIVELPKGEEEC